ncbi:hypothetical protein FRC00_012627 [Tulasnella sp. 408]|nr:hypothetical protein FRC00_012627 [Tulasnella sp. 408]
MSEPHRVAGGHKAAIANPNVSEDAKDHSRQVLDSMEKSGDLDYKAGKADKNPGNVIGGKKAAISNPRVPEETKDRLRDELAEDGVELDK